MLLSGWNGVLEDLLDMELRFCNDDCSWRVDSVAVGSVSFGRYLGDCVVFYRILLMLSLVRLGSYYVNKSVDFVFGSIERCNYLYMPREMFKVYTTNFPKTKLYFYISPAGSISRHFKSRPTRHHDQLIDIPRTQRNFR